MQTVGFTSIVKYDVTKDGNQIAAETKFGENMFGGEAVFVPRHEKEEDMQGTSLPKL